MTSKRTNPDFLNGVPELLILQLLAGQPMYGYELVQAIRRESNEVLEFGEGCIYPILHRLEEQQVLESSRTTVGGRSRVVYRVTHKGAQRLAASVAAWQRITDAVHAVLQGNGHGRRALA